MKSRYLLILCIFLFLSAVSYAECSGYIVTLKEDRPFSAYSFILFDAENLYDIENIHENIYYAKDNDVLENLIEDGMIESYEEDQIVYLFDDAAEYNDENFAEQWYWDIIKADTAREITKEASSVRIGIIDSGICYEHPDLIGADIDLGYDVVNNKPGAEAEFYHGNFASGIIAARADNNTGIVGICDNVTIIPIKCFKGKTSSLRYIIDGMYKAVDDYDCDILNMSLGLENESALLKDAVDHAVSKNVIIAAAVGNKYGSKVYYPAGYENVIGVGAAKMIDGELTHADYSQINNSVYITAPGSRIYSTDYVDTDSGRIYTYSARNGTSFAAPMISAFLAAAKTIYPKLTIADAFEILKESAEDLGDAGYDEIYGYGIINMEKGINYLKSSKGLDKIQITESTETPSIPTDTPPIPTETLPVPTDTPPVPTDTPPVPTDTPPVPTETLPIPTDTPLVPMDTPPVPTDTPKTPVNIYIEESNNILTLTTDTEDNESTLIVALYDEDGNMVSIKICSISIAYNNKLFYNINNSRYKIMLWESLNSMLPVEFNIVSL